MMRVLYQRSVRKLLVFGMVALVLGVASESAMARGRLGSLEQMPIEVRKKLRTVEKYQIDVAQKFYLKGEYKIAQTEYEKYIKLYERSAAAPYAQLMWSNCLVNLRLGNTAIKDGFRSVIDYWPDSEEAKIAAYRIGEVYKNIGELHSAKKAYSEVIESHPKDLISLRAKQDLIAIAKIEKDDERRIELYKNLTFDVKRDTKAKQAICQSASHSLASHYLYGGAMGEAMKALKTSHENESSLVYYVYSLSRSPISHLTGQKDSKKREAGIQMADSVIGMIEKRIPTDITDASKKKLARDWYFRVADVHGRARRAEEVFKTYEVILKLFGKDDGILGVMARWCRNNSQRKKAREYYAQYENKVSSLAVLAEMDREERKYDDAIARYQQLKKIDKRDGGPDGWQWEIGNCYYYKNEREQALKEYEACTPTPGRLTHIGRVLRGLKRYRAALQQFTFARDHANKTTGASATAQIEIGYTYEIMKNKANAIRAFQQVCKKYPKTGTASKAHAHLQSKYGISITLGGTTEDGLDK